MVDGFDEFKIIIIEVVFFRIGTHLLVEESEQSLTMLHFTSYFLSMIF